MNAAQKCQHLASLRKIKEDRQRQDWRQQEFKFYTKMQNILNPGLVTMLLMTGETQGVTALLFVSFKSTPCHLYMKTDGQVNMDNRKDKLCRDLRVYVYRSVCDVFM